MIDIFLDGLNTAPAVHTISFKLIDKHCDIPLCMSLAPEIHFLPRQMQWFSVLANFIIYSTVVILPRIIDTCQRKKGLMAYRNYDSGLNGCPLCFLFYFCLYCLKQCLDCIREYGRGFAQVKLVSVLLPHM